jgi:hypothetical protein
VIEKVETILTFFAKQQNCTIFAYQGSEDLARLALERKLEHQQNFTTIFWRICRAFYDRCFGRAI